MKKHAYVITGIVVVVGGYLLYRKYRQPSVTLNQIDWQNNTAAMTIDGKVVRISGIEAVSLGRGYSVEMDQGFRQDLGMVGAVNLVLKKDGSIVKLISYYQQ
jgi:hypothetical protein